MNTRRKLIIAVGAGALAWARGVRAQTPPPGVRRIGLLAQTSASVNAAWYEALRLGLRDLGWIEGKNVIIEYRHAEGRLDRLDELAAELVRLKVDVIVTTASSDTLAAKKATRSIPIVMAAGSDPVATGAVESYARPGGNVTGLSQMVSELAGKRLELLKEVIAKLSRVAVLWNPLSVSASLNWKEVQRSAPRLGIQIISLEVRSPTDFEKAFEDAVKARAGALVTLADPVTGGNLKQIAGLAASRFPSIYHDFAYAEVGGLLSYGAHRGDLYRRAATYVDKIFKGAKPESMPVEQPTKFELVVNMRTAKALGITIPESVRFRADRVIE